MGNCQDQIQQISEYDTQNDRHTVLIDRSHKRIFATKHQPNVGFLIHQENHTLDNQKMHKSIALTRKSYLEKPQPKTKHVQIEPQKLEILDLTFYRSLGLPQYTYPQKSVEMTLSLRNNERNIFIDQAEDRTGVIYIGQRNSSGLFHGNGVLKANTVHYIGQFYQGTKHFHGRQIYTYEVYEGQFNFDFRKGRGIRYTQDYVDQGEYDKVILYGTRRWKNGNFYQGTFVNNKMETNENTQYQGQFSFYDAKNNLLYKNGLEIRNDQLIKAKEVYKNDTKEMLGCYVDGQIIRVNDPRYQQIIISWDRALISSPKQPISSRYQNITQQEKIKHLIQQWE